MFYFWGALKAPYVGPRIKANANLLVSFSKNVFTASSVLGTVLCAWATATQDTATIIENLILLTGSHRGSCYYLAFSFSFNEEEIMLSF